MANPFTKLFDLGSLFSAKPDGVFGLDVGSSSVKMIQLKKEDGKVILQTYGELSIGPYHNLAVGQSATLTPPELQTILADLIKEANVTTKVGGISIPVKESLMVSVTVPDLPDTDLSEVIPLEARKFVPVPIAEVILDWWVVPKNKSEEIDAEQEAKKNKTVEMQNVMVVAIHKDTIKQYEDLSTALTLEPKFVEIETFSAMRSVLSNELGAVAVVDLGASSTKVAVVDYGVVRMSHTVPKGGQDITMSISHSLNLPFGKAEEVKREIGLLEKVGSGNLKPTVSPTVEFIFAEVNRVLANFEQKSNRAISKVILIGGGAALPGLLPIVQGHLSQPVEVGLPFDRVVAPTFLDPVLKEVGPSFAVAIGLALRALQEI